MSVESLDDFAKAELQSAASFLIQLRYDKWPRYYQHLLLCYNPFEHEVRVFQCHFIVINHIPFGYYLLLLKLNYHVGYYLPKRLYVKLLKDYNYVLNKAFKSPISVRSYNITLDGVCNYNTDDVFRRDELGQYFQNNYHPKPQFCNYRLMREYLTKIGLYNNNLPYTLKYV